MRSIRNLFVASIALLLSGRCPAFGATVVADSEYSLKIRTTGLQGFPIAVDQSASMYTVTGTSVADSLKKIAPSGSVTVLNGAVGHVVGVGADLDFGFGGDLFANCGVSGYPSPQGVVRFNHITGAASDFYVYSGGYADGGLAFSSSRQLLYLINETDNSIHALNSAGQESLVMSNVVANPWGMDIDSNGNLLVISRVTGDIVRVDPIAHTKQTLVTLSQTLSGTFPSIAVDPNTGDIFCDRTDNSLGYLYRMNPDGSNITLIAYTTDPGSGFLSLAIGPSGDGSGNTSVYMSDPWVSTMFELRPAPEPGSLLLLGIGASAQLLRRRRRNSQR